MAVNSFCTGIYVTKVEIYRRARWIGGTISVGHVAVVQGAHVTVVAILRYDGAFNCVVR